MGIVSHSGRSLNTFLVVAMAILAICRSTAAYGYDDDAYQPTEWQSAHATFYGDDSGSATMGGACGYGNQYQNGLDVYTAALSTALFNDGYACGECYEVRCVDSKHCYHGNTAMVTATNICPPNWAEDPNYGGGGWCNPPRAHFDLSKPAFTKIAYWRAGIVPVQYRRVACKRQEGMRFSLQGNAYWLLVYVMNVGGAGDVANMWVKGSRTGWIAMSHNWGVSYQAFAQLGGQALSFKVTCFTTKQTIIARNVAPASWRAGMTYQADVNFR